MRELSDEAYDEIADAIVAATERLSADEIRELLGSPPVHQREAVSDRFVYWNPMFFQSWDVKK